MQTENYGMRYTKVSADEFHQRVDQVISQQLEASSKIIPDAEFDQLFDLVEMKLKEVGRFNGNGMLSGGADFCSSRYVDQIPYVNVVVADRISLRKLIKIGYEIHKQSHRPFCLLFEDEKDCLAVFPDLTAIGTIEPEQNEK